MRIYLLFFIVFCLKNSAHGEIIRTSIYEEAAAIISTANENTWVVFDVDDVLITFQNPLLPTHTNELVNYIYELSNNSNLTNLLYEPYKMKLIHPEWPNLIHTLQSKDIKTIALTKAYTGQSNYFNNLVKLRYNTLRQFNIHFNRSFPNLAPKKFTTRFSCSNPPLFNDGIIYSCGFPKTIYLEEFIKYSKQKPSKIIFIDNEKKNVKEMELFCRKNNIESTCIHYTFVKENKTNTFFDKDIKSTYEELKKDYIHFVKMTPPILPQQESLILSSLKMTKTDKVDEVPYVDHIEWLKEIYSSIQETLENIKKRDNLTQSNISLLHKLLTENKIPPEQEDIDAILSELNTKSEENHYEISLPPQENTYTQNILDKFDQKDAKNILAPMLKKHFEFDLTPYIIGSLFLPYSQLNQKANHQKSDPSLFYNPKNQTFIFEAASKTYDLVKDNVLFVLGQAPAYLGIAIQEIADAQNDHDTKIINVPFSGCPDYTQKLPDHYQPELSYLNIVTHDKETIFRKILFEHQFSPKSTDAKKIFIVDYSNGHSFETFIHLLKRWFNDEQVIYPEIHIVHMGNPTSLTIADSYAQTFLEMDAELLHAFNTLEDNLRIVPRFPALYWRDDYPKLLKQYPKNDAIPLMEQYKKFARETIQQ